MRRTIPVLCLLIALCCTACARPGKTTVVWISVDGLRGDYVERAHAPFLMHMMHQAAYTRQLRPAFPTITFPSHASEATGVTVDVHGITGNEIYEPARRAKHSFPQDRRILEAEPIWETATRQGVRAAVFDWVFSNVQTGANAAAYFSPAEFDGRLTDQARLDRLVVAYENDQPRAGQPPLQLAMGYMPGVDKAGHRYGPESPEVDAEVRHADAILAAAFERFRTAWEKRKAHGDVLVFMITTDHGMRPVTHVANLPRMLGLQANSDVMVVVDGPLANIFVPEGEAKAQRVTALLAKLAGRNQLKAYRRDHLPRHWRYAHPQRAGDIVVMLDQGWTFASRLSREEMTVAQVKTENPDRSPPLGMHGYPVETDPQMQGFMLIWRSDGHMNARNLGPIETIRLHGTVAKWLKVQPAGGAHPPIPDL